MKVLLDCTVGSGPIFVSVRFRDRVSVRHGLCSIGYGFVPQ